MSSDAPEPGRHWAGAVIVAGICVLVGFALQALLAPDAPAWGFYEVSGFVAATVVFAWVGIVHLRGQQRQP